MQCVFALCIKIKIEWRVHCIVWLMRIMTATTMMMAMLMLVMMMTGTLHPIVDPPVVSARGVALFQAPQLSIFLSFYHYLAYSWLSIIKSAYSWLSIIILRIFLCFSQCQEWHVIMHSAHSGDCSFWDINSKSEKKIVEEAPVWGLDPILYLQDLWIPIPK